MTLSYINVVNAGIKHGTYMSHGAFQGYPAVPNNELVHYGNAVMIC